MLYRLIIVFTSVFVDLQALRVTNYDSDTMLRTCGVSISRDFVQIEGRVLPTPKVFESLPFLNLLDVSVGSCYMTSDFFSAESWKWGGPLSTRWPLEFQQQGYLFWIAWESW